MLSISSRKPKPCFNPLQAQATRDQLDSRKTTEGLRFLTQKAHAERDSSNTNGSYREEQVIGKACDCGIRHIHLKILSSDL